MDVITVCCFCWFCCSFCLVFLIMSDLIHLMWHFFLLHWTICVGGNIFVHSRVFRKTPHVLEVFYLSSFSRPLCEECGRAVSKLYVLTRITELPCLSLHLESLFRKIWRMMFFCSSFRKRFFLYLICVQPSFESNLSQLIKKN